MSLSEESIDLFAETFESRVNSLLSGTLTSERFLQIYEDEISGEVEPRSRAHLRYLLGQQLLRVRSLPQALHQLEIAEKELASSLNSTEDLDGVENATLLAFLVAALADKAECFARLGLGDSGNTLDRATEVLYGAVFPTSANARESAFEKALLVSTHISSGIASSDPISGIVLVALIRLGLKYADLLQFRRYILQSEILEAVLWLKLAFDSLNFLHREDDVFKFFFVDCARVAGELWKQFPVDAVCEEGSENDPLCIVESILEFFGSDEGMAIFEVARKHFETTEIPLRQLGGLMAAQKCDYDEDSIIALKGYFDYKGDATSSLSCLFLLGKISVQHGDLETGVRRMTDAWNSLDRILPLGHPWRAVVQSSLGDALSLTCEREKKTLALEYTILSTAELALSVPWQLLLAYFWSLADICAEQNPTASVFFGKLCIRSWTDLLPGQSDAATFTFATVLEYSLGENLEFRLSSQGRFAEAFQVQHLSQSFDIERTGLISRESLIANQGSVTFTQFELGLFDSFLKATQIQTENLSEKFRLIRASLEEAIRYRLESQQELELIRREGERFLKSERQSRLPQTSENTCLVCFSSFHDVINVILATSSGVKTVEVALGETELFSRIFRFLSLCRDPTDESYSYSFYGKSSYQAAGEELFASIFSEEAMAFLRREEIDRLVIAATRVFRFIPFGALFDGEKYLIQKYEIVLLPEFEVDLTTSPVFPRNVALLGSSFLEAPRLGRSSPLPYVHAELDSVRRSIRAAGESRIVDLRDERFQTEAALRALDGTSSLVHIASHFAFDPSSIGNSCLLLGDGGQLKVDQICSAQPELDGVDLVVLSACETGQITGDRWRPGMASSLAGLIHALGARSVLASLWPVRDQSTAALIGGFYENLFHDGCKSKSASLREAQLRVMNSSGFSHPHYWAPFVLSGNYLPFVTQPELD